MRPCEFVVVDTNHNEVLTLQDELGLIESDLCDFIEQDERTPDQLAVYKLSHTVSVNVEVKLNPVTKRKKV